MPNHHKAIRSCCGDALQRVVALLQKFRSQQQIFGGVAANGQFRKKNQIVIGLMGQNLLDDFLGIAC